MSSRKRISHKSKYLLLVYILRRQCLQGAQKYIQKRFKWSLDKELIDMMGVLVYIQITEEFF